MPRAVFNGKVLAESDDYEIVEGNVYFPPSAINREYFKDSGHNTMCPWKGVASYYSISVDGADVSDVAWYYPDPKRAAKKIKDYVAFYPAVKIEG